MSVVDSLDAALELVIRGRQFPVRIHLGPDEMADLVETVCFAVSLAGDERPILGTIEDEHLDLMPVVDVGDGKIHREVTRAALQKMRELKRARGIGAFQGVPVVLGRTGEIRLETRHLGEGE